MPFKPKLGEDFLASGNVIAEKTRYIREKTRAFIACLMFLSSFFAVLVSSLVSVVTGASEPLLYTWSAIAGPLGWVVCYYFRQVGDGDERHDSNSTRTP